MMLHELLPLFRTYYRYPRQTASKRPTSSESSVDVMVKRGEGSQNEIKWQKTVDPVSIKSVDEMNWSRTFIPLLPLRSEAFGETLSALPLITLHP